MKIFSLVLFVFLSMNVYSQQKFIEVNVDDTVQVTPDLFIYSIMPKDKNELLNDANAFDQKSYKNTEKEIVIKRTKVYDSLKAALQQSGFRILNPSLGSTVMIDDDKTYAINIIISTADSVILLYNQIKNLSFVTGFLLTAKAKDENEYYNLLYEKLISKATMKAKKIAELSQHQLGVIYSISENKEDKTFGGWTAYPPLSMLASNTLTGWHTTIYKNQLTDNSYSITDSLTVRFEIQ